MKLQENIQRIRQVMGLNESFFDWFKKSENNLGRPYGDDFEEERFTCEDCGEKNYNMYMVNDDLWKEYGNEEMTLCKSCLEKRMGRELNKDDISQHKNALTNIYNPDLKHFYKNVMES